MDHEQREIDWTRLDRYVRGAGDANERARLAEWVDSDPRLRKLAESMRSVGSASAPSGASYDAKQALGNVRKQMKASESSRADSGVTLKHGLVAAAAIAAVFAVVAVLPSERDQRGVDAKPSAPQVVETKAGQRARVKLPDGTEVAISPGSRLTYASNLGSSDIRRREVSIAGEAMFRVKHDSTHLFVVRTPYGSVEDLGTEFVVNTYPETDGMQLAVREGRAAVRVTGSSTSGAARVDSAVATLGEGDVARVKATGDLTVARHQNVSPMFAGPDGVLELRSTELRAAIPQLERWFGINVHVGENSLLARRISGTFRDESAQDAIALIALALHQTARWSGTTVTLTRRGDPEAAR